MKNACVFNKKQSKRKKARYRVEKIITAKRIQQNKNENQVPKT